MTISPGSNMKQNYTVSQKTHQLWNGTELEIIRIGLEDEKLTKKQTYMKSEAYKLYSRVCWILLPSAIKVGAYNLS